MFLTQKLRGHCDRRTAFVLAVFLSGAFNDPVNAQSYCTGTAWNAYVACQHEIQDDHWITRGNCKNISDSEERYECIREAVADLREARKLCSAQRKARRAVCDVIGESRYDPQIDPEDFVDFEAVIEDGEKFTLNPYFLLVPGSFREFLVSDSEGAVIERVLVEVLAETREIAGVQCIVVRDRVWEFDDEGEEEIIEDTFDWLGQHKETGDVWYFGEEAKDFEDGSLVSVEGSFEHGKDFAKAGIWVLAQPVADELYRQEFHLGNAEDVATVVNVGVEAVTVPTGTYSEGVLKTMDSSPLEPGGFEYKFYAPGVGLVMEVNPGSGDRLELVEIHNP